MGLVLLREDNTP